MHKWTFTEFKEFSESVLGKASAWHLGTLAVGFSITREGGAVKVAPATGNQKLMLDYVDSNALITAMDEDSAFAEHDTAFYVGVWGESAPEAVFSGFPVSMDMARQPLFPREGAWVVNRRGTEFIPDWKVKEDYQSLKDRISALEDELAISQREATRLGILRRVILGENELASRAMSRYKHELQTTREELNEAKRSHLDTLNRVSGLEERTAALESHAAALEAEAAASAARLASVPWRVVWVWWKIRRIIPTRVLVRTVRVLNFVRGNMHNHEAHLGWNVEANRYVTSRYHQYLDEGASREEGGNIGINGEHLTITFLSLNRSGLSKKLCRSIAEHIPAFKGEVLIIDNGSTEDELESLERYLAGMPFKWRIERLGQNYGVAGGRNRTMPFVQTPWVMMLDNDIYLLKNPLPSIQRDLSLLGCHFMALTLLNDDKETTMIRGGNIYLGLHENELVIGCGSAYLPSFTAPEGPGF